MITHSPGSLYLPLPSATQLLSAFQRGAPRPDSICPEIVQIGVELVEAHRHCWDSERRCRAYASDPHDDGYRWANATAKRLAAREQVTTAVAAIDAEVQRNRIHGRARLSIAGLLVTESVGQVVSRMAWLWVVVDANSSNNSPLPESTELASLCQGYTSLIEGLTTGAFRLPESWTGLLR